MLQAHRLGDALCRFADDLKAADAGALQQRVLQKRVTTHTSRGIREKGGFGGDMAQVLTQREGYPALPREYRAARTARVTLP